MEFTLIDLNFFFRYIISQLSLKKFGNFIKIHHLLLGNTFDSELLLIKTALIKDLIHLTR